jgi:hypothetical protein
MRRAVVGNPDQLVYLDGGGCVVAVGVVFAAAGAFFLFLGLTKPVNFGAGPLAPLWGKLFVTGLSLLFLLLGAAIAVSRSGVTLDRKARTVNRWWGMWRPWGAAAPAAGVPAGVRVLSRPKPRHVTEHTAVTVGREVQRIKDRESIVYPVRIDCHPAVQLTIFPNELDARHLAEEVARFLTVALVDGTSGTDVRREPDTLGRPLAERVKRLELPATVAPPPDGSRLTYSIENGRLTFTAPREPFDPFLLAFVVGPLLFSGAVYFFLYRGQNGGLGPGAWAPAVGGVLLVLGVPVLLGLAALAGSVYWGGSLAVTAGGIAVRARGRLFGSADLPVMELDEVRVGKAAGRWRVSVGGVSVRSDPNAANLELQLITRNRIVGFGRGRSRTELEWVRDVVLKSIAS